MVTAIAIVVDRVDMCGYSIAHRMDEKFQCGSHIKKSERVIIIFSVASEQASASIGSSEKDEKVSCCCFLIIGLVMAVMGRCSIAS